MGGLVSRSFRRSSDNRSNGLSPPWPPGLYRYSSSSEHSYFSSHYYLGHRKFETGEPEVFLFGDLQDLNYLPSKPVKFPYKQPPRSQPLRTLRSFINVQRDSIKLVKAQGSDDNFHIGFTFDSDIPCQFTVFTGVADSIEVDSLGRGKTSESVGSTSAIYKYGAGCEQQFNEVDHVIQPSQLRGEGYDPVNGLHTIPLAILMETDNDGAPESQQQALLSLCTIDTFGEDNFSIKIIKQKLLVGGLEMLLQELYGLENKLKPKEDDDENREGGDDSDSEAGEEDLGAECVICITDVKDTLLLPCRHLCLCSSCAANLRFQASNCPICRAPFRALLQIRALEPLPPDFTIDDDTLSGDPKYAVPGFRCVPLLQALNGYQLEEDGAEDKEEESECQTRDQMDSLQTTSSPSSAEATTEFCVIHIEDGAEQVTSEPVESPCRTTAKPLQTETGKVVRTGNSKTILLPGTPDTNHTPLIPMCDHDNSDSTCDPQASWCGSSVSSEVSVKSTEALIGLGKN